MEARAFCFFKHLNTFLRLRKGYKELLRIMGKNKRILLISFFLCFFTLTSRAQEIIYEGENDGVMMLSVSEFNINKKDAVAQAIKDVYFQLLFRGIPGSKDNKQALLGTDENVMNANRQYYDNMISEGRLYSFVNYSTLSYYKKKNAVVKLTLNVQALIADLERNNLYRRFGLH